MVLYTSYFSRSSNNPDALSISCGVPNWYNGRQCHLLAPSWELVNGIKQNTITEAQYTEQYRQKLDELGEQKVISVLHEGDVLLCWESEGKFCHRHILADWLKEHDHTVTELGG